MSRRLFVLLLAVALFALPAPAGAHHSTAMFNLALLLQTSDPNAATALYQRAAEAGDTNSMINLAYLLEQRDPDAAQSWYARAADASRSHDGQET